MANQDQLLQNKDLAKLHEIQEQYQKVKPIIDNIILTDFARKGLEEIKQTEHYETIECPQNHPEFESLSKLAQEMVDQHWNLIYTLQRREVEIEMHYVQMNAKINDSNQEKMANYQLLLTKFTEKLKLLQEQNIKYEKESKQDQANITKLQSLLNKSQKKFKNSHKKFKLLKQKTSEMQLQHSKDMEMYKECKICMDRKANFAIIPCGHMILCIDCKDKIKETCPVCNSEYTCIIQIYI